MRLIWTATAITYGATAYFYQKSMHDIKQGNLEFDVDEFWIILLVISCFEYLFLGCLECFVKMISFEKILSKIEKSSQHLPKCWAKLQVRTYYLALFAYAIRNFSLSLYFGLLSVIINFDEAIKDNPYTGVTLVLQIYLAMIRGRFYGLFMHAFLSIFMIEEDDETFKKLQEDEDENDANEEIVETKLLQEPRRKIVTSDLQDTSFKNDFDDTTI